MSLSARTTRTSSSSTASRTLVSPVLSSPSSHQRQRINPVGRSTLKLSRPYYRACWLLFFATHTVSVAVSAGTIAVNLYLQDDDIGVILSFLGGSPRYFLRHVVLANALLLSGHLYELLEMVSHSVYHRQLLLNALVKQPARIRDEPSIQAPTLVHKPKSTFISCFTAKFARKGSFGIEGAYYDTVYTAVEVVSVIVRIFQAFRISTWISRLWINLLFALVAVLSCFSIPLLKLWVLPTQQLKRRVGLLAADSSFDFITSILMPTAIAIPYVLEYDLVLADFPLINYYRDTWVVQAVSENRQVFAVSWLDLFAKNYPKFSCLCAMALIKTCVSEHRHESSEASSSSMIRHHQSMGPLSRKRTTAVAPTSSTSLDFSKSLKPLPIMREITAFARESWRQRAVSKKYWLHNGFFILSGLAVLAVHTQAVTRTWGGSDTNNTSACLLKMHPWFGSSSYYCAVVEIRCTHLQSISHNGNTTELDAFLRFLHPETVKGLIFSSCAQLQMPLVVSEFTNLQLIKIYNSTIASWDGEAMLTGTNHPHMQLVYIVNSNMTHVPQGLLSKDDFPPTLSDIEFCGTNLTKLPSEVGIIWSPLYFFVLERSPGITEFPTPLAQLQLSYISLQSNSITKIPDELLANQTLWMLGLSNNPLERLPDSIGDVSKLFQVFMRSTLISELPVWMSSLSGTRDAVAPQTSVQVEAGGSQLCTEVDQAEVLRSVSPMFIVNCEKDERPGANYYYPLEQEIQWRQHA